MSHTEPTPPRFGTRVLTWDAPNLRGDMSDEDRYPRLAKFCREQASLLRGAEGERWAHLAGEYERLADGHSALSQQQQSQPKPKPEDEK
jgi:hypothetical protein